MGRNYVDLSETGEAAGSMLTGGVMNALGYEDKDSALERVFKEADFSTDEGKEAALAAVAKIDPDAYQEMITQFSNTANTEAATANTLMNTENQLIAHKQKIFGGKYAREFERQAGPNGEGFSIHYFLQKNEIDFDPAKVKTIAQGAAAIKKHMGKDSAYKGTQTQLNSYVGEQKQMFITMRATQDAGVEINSNSSSSSKTSATANKFDTTMPTDTSDTGTTTTSNLTGQRASELETTKATLNKLIAKLNAGDNSSVTAEAITRNQARLQELMPNDFDRLSDWRTDSNAEAEANLKTVLTSEGLVQKVPKHYVETQPGSMMWVPGERVGLAKSNTDVVTADQMTNVFDF